MNIEHGTVQRIFKIRSELQEVYWNLLIQNFAKSMIGIFIPIYLLIIGLELEAVFWFAFFHYLTFMFFSIFAGRMTAALGHKHLIFYRIPLFVAYYGMLVLLQFMPFPMEAVYLAAVLGGVSTSLYWVPLNSEFVKNTKKLHTGQEIAASVALPSLASIAAPTIAALVLGALGFSTLFVLVIFLLLLSVIPLFATSDYKSSFRFSEGRGIFFTEKAISMRSFLWGMLSIAEVFVWPIFVFLTLESALDVGLAVSGVAAGAALFTLLMGKLSDRGKKGDIMVAGALGYAAVWFLRAFSQTFMEILLLSLIGGLFVGMLKVTKFSYFCEAARKGVILNWVVLREMLICSGRILFVLAILLVPGIDLRALFMIAGAASLLFLVRGKKR